MKTTEINSIQLKLYINNELIIDRHHRGERVKMLRITGCTDPGMWYAGLVGELVPHLGEWPESYKSLEPAGFVNMVKFEDAEIVTVSDGEAAHENL